MMSTTPKRRTFCLAEQQCLGLVCVCARLQEITYQPRSDGSGLGRGRETVTEGEREAGICEDLHWQRMIMPYNARERAMIG